MNRELSECNRCGHIWLKRKNTIRTKQCPNPECHSPYWDKKRIRNVVRNGD